MDKLQSLFKPETGPAVLNTPMIFKIVSSTSIQDGNYPKQQVVLELDGKQYEWKLSPDQYQKKFADLGAGSGGEVRVEYKPFTNDPNKFFFATSIPGQKRPAASRPASRPTPAAAPAAAASAKFDMGSFEVSSVRDIFLGLLAKGDSLDQEYVDGHIMRAAEIWQKLKGESPHPNSMLIETDPEEEALDRIMWGIGG